MIVGKFCWTKTVFQLKFLRLRAVGCEPDFKFYLFSGTSWWEENWTVVYSSIDDGSCRKCHYRYIINIKSLPWIFSHEPDEILFHNLNIYFAFKLLGSLTPNYYRTIFFSRKKSVSMRRYERTEKFASNLPRRKGSKRKTSTLCFAVPYAQDGTP